MRQTLNTNPGAEQQPVSWSYGCDDGSDGDGSQNINIFWGRYLCMSISESTGAYAQCIDGDEVSCLWNGYVHVVGDVCDDAPR